MRKLAALFTAFILILSTCAVGVSAAEYGRNPDHSEVTAKGEYIYYISEKKICRIRITDGKEEVLSELDNDDIIDNLSILGNCLYYTAYDGYDKVCKLDIGSGKKTKIWDCRDSQYEISVVSLVTAGNRVYISVSESVHEEVSDDYYVYIYDTDGKYLGNFTPCKNNYNVFIDASNCEACAVAKESKIVFTYPDHGDEDEEDWFDGDPDDWYLEYTGVYNIVKIKSDLSEERINIPAKIGKNVNRFVYCGEKYVYYIDNNYRLCRYNSETEKYSVIADNVCNAHYKNGVLHFFTAEGDLKKYENGKVSTVKKAPDKEQSAVSAYFFNDYILYYDHGGQTYCIIDYSGKELVSVDLN